jgi:hypothetical protein
MSDNKGWNRPNNATFVDILKMMDELYSFQKFLLDVSRM